MSHLEEKAQRIACELDHGQINQAAYDLRREVDTNPRDALALIQMANQMRDQRGPDHIVVERNGCVEVKDEYRHTEAFAGTSNLNSDIYSNNGYQNRGYQDNDAYRQPPVYEQPQRMNIPDCYGNQDRSGINTGIAIGIAGGLILNRVLGHGGQYHPREHHR